MEPYLGRVAINIAVLLVILALIPLPFLRMGSAEFIVDILALIFTLSFLFLIAWDVKREAGRETAK